MKVICTNRKARFNFHIMETYETGLVLVGTEVKSIRAGGVTIDEAYVIVRNGELRLVNAYIKEFEFGNQFNHETTRQRALLAGKREIQQMATAVERKGLTLIPLKLYFKGPWAKLEIGVGKSKDKRDKRQDQARREAKRDMERAIKLK